MKKLNILFLSLILIFPVFVLAKVGVGIGTGKIVLDQPLKPGLIYTLPILTILNTGDESSMYGVSITHRENQSEMNPPLDWFSFSPATFKLEPGKAQQVQVKLSIPIKGAKPGSYFVFLEGHPIKTVTAGGTTIGVAAAAKLYFTIESANIFVGLYYRIASLLTIYAPWSYVVLAIIIIAILILLIRKYFSLNFGFSVKKK